MDLPWIKLKEIIDNSDNKVNHAIWLLEMYRYGIKYEKNWEYVIDDIVENIINPENQNNKKLYSVIKKIREQFYILFITNISTQIIIRKIMLKLLESVDDLKLKYFIRQRKSRRSLSTQITICFYYYS